MFHESLRSCNYNFVISILDTMFELTETIHFEKNLDTVYDEVIKKMSILYGWEYGELWIFDDKRNKLRKSPIYYSKSEQTKKFGTESGDVSFSFDEGLPGRTWKQRKSIWIQNIQYEPTFKRRDLAKESGLKTAVTIPILAYDHVEAIMFFFNCEEQEYDPLVVQVLEHLSQNIGINIIKTRLEQQVKIFRDTNDKDQLGYPLLESLFSFRDPYTMRHQLQVAKLATDIAEKMGHDETTLSHIRTAAMIHDIGKINVPMEILSKPGKLTESEFNLIREHPKLGYDIIKNIDLSNTIKRIVLEHHEHLDGTGYPNHLKGCDILDESKILTVADVISAMLENRPYRTALTKSSVRKELLKYRGVFYSPEVVDVALDLINDYEIVQA